MHRFLLCAALLLCPLFSSAQSLNITRWVRNTTGKVATYYFNGGGMPPAYTWTISTDSADVLKVAYTADSVWVRSNGLTDSMGKYLNPGGCTAQAYTHRFPRTPYVPATKVISPKGGAIGLLMNGVPVYGLSNSNSYNGSTNTNNGSGVWNVEVGKSEGFVLDVNYGAHPQQQGAYHTHDKPYRMYRDSGTTKHSPLIGFAFDGHPIYGPYGYSSPMNAASAIGRMKTGYSLRNILVRTTLPVIPNGGGAASQTGPVVSTTYPIGTYIEDYEWLASNGGDLDEYNGRLCVTPDYPAGTYAYFVTIDAAANAAFPYYIGVYYYGQPVTANYPTVPGSLSNGLTIPAGATLFSGGVVLPIRLISFSGGVVGEANRLDWTIASSETLSGIVVERSEDGQHFFPIGDVLPLRGRGSNETYRFTDERPLPLAYYRLQMREDNGEKSLSAVVLLKRESAGSLTVYPTVASTTIRVEQHAHGKAAKIAVTDCLGHTVISVVTNPSESITSLDVSSLASGMYLLQVEGRPASETVRFFKQ